MADIKDKVILLHSSDKTVEQAKLNVNLTGDAFNEGELAIITKSGDEALLIKNSEGKIIDFRNKDIFVVNNYDWGIYSDGTNSLATTNGLNNAFKYANACGYRRVLLEKGTYLVTQNLNGIHNNHYNDSLVLQSNTEYDLNGSIIVQEGHDKQLACTMLLYKLDNVTIKNGIIRGDRDIHDYTPIGTHENVFGINIVGGKNIKLCDLNITKCTGDCIIVAGTSNFEGFDPNQGAKNVTIEKCELSHSRRQGISIVNAFNCIVDTCYIHDIGLVEENGTPPNSGIDIEPWNETFVAEIVLDTIIRNCRFENNRRHLIIAGPYIHNTLIEGCSFESKELETAPIYNDDLPNAINDTPRSPDFTHTTQNKFPVDIYWKNVNTVVRGCNFKNCNTINCAIIENCTYTGTYNAIYSQLTEIKPIVKNCRFYNNTLFSGQSNLTISESQIENVYKSNSGINIDNCIIGNILSGEGFKSINNSIINNSSKTISGSLSNSTITFSNRNGDIYVYLNTYYDNCNITLKDFPLSSFNKILNITNSFITIDYAGTAIINDNGNILLDNNVIKINHSNGTYSSKYVQSNHLISVNNTILNDIERTKKVPTFGYDGVIRNNTYIGKNLINENTQNTNFGTTNQKPSLSEEDTGFQYYDITINKPVWWNGIEWINGEGNSSDLINRGPTSQRPTNAPEGFRYFDTDLEQEIIWDGTQWLNTDGTLVNKVVII